MRAHGAVHLCHCRTGSRTKHNKPLIIQIAGTARKAVVPTPDEPSAPIGLWQSECQLLTPTSLRISAEELM
jgi:hypothetical protein